MFKKLILIFSISLLISQQQSITDIVVAQRTDGSGIVDIFYNLNDPSAIFPSFEISGEISLDNGVTWSSMSNQATSGDYGTVGPGLGKHILLWAPSYTYSNTVLIKLIGEGHYVTSELPFTTITISPDSIMVFESETIDYSFEIMQYELTNSQLVEWLETYPFNAAVNYDVDNPWDDTADAQYNCSDYSDYNFDNDTGGYGDGYGGSSDEWGCMDSNALNYNPYATNQGQCDCTYGSIQESYGDDCNQSGPGVGCPDPYALNGYDGGCSSNCGFWNDCSCQEITDLNGFDYNSEENLINCEWSDGVRSIINDWGGDDWGTRYEISACTDPTALNYAELLVNECATLQNSNNSDQMCCIAINNPDQCIYEGECTYDGFDLQGYSSIEEFYENQTYNNPDAVTISDFYTADISYVGSAFTIQPGRSDYPVRFDANDCAHSVVLSLYINYFGLRVPTAGEWMKSARADNTRCWPWMTSTCQTDGDALCSAAFSCLDTDQANDCGQETQDCYWECDEINDQCESDFMGDAISCITDCFYSTDGTFTCSDPQYTDQGLCEDNGNSWDPVYLYPDCEDCVDDVSEMQWSLCFSGEQSNCYCDDFTTHIEDACSECMVVCGVGDDEDGEGDGEPHPCEQYNPEQNENICVDQEVDYDEDGQIDNPSCFGDYADYCTAGSCDSNSCWDDNNTCQQNYQNCMGSDCGWDQNVDENLNCSDCNVVNVDNLNNYLNEIPNDTIPDFISNLYYNRFNYIQNWDDHNSSDWPNLSTVGQYPTGVSPYGLYDVIGNAPELIVKSIPGSSDNAYYVMGGAPNVSNLWSFCTDEDFGSYNHQAQNIYDGNNGVRFFGVRLVRTVTESSE